MQPPSADRPSLPLPVPHGHAERTVLFALRRMAAHGIRDANATWIMLDTFGVHFRRPLVLLRAFLMELAHSSRGPIQVAPCCARRMTAHEGNILAILFGADGDVDHARDALTRLTGNPGVAEPLSAAVVFSRAVLAAPGRGQTAIAQRIAD